jgi:hypothetical protein
MTVYRDSKRIVGTNADRIGTPAVSGGWKEVGRTTLGSATSTIDVTSLDDKRYYMVLTDAVPDSGTLFGAVQLNADSGNNYAYRQSRNGGADSPATSNTSYQSGPAVTASPYFCVDYLSNLSSKEKLGILNNVNSASGAGSAPNRMEQVHKHAQTSNPITSYKASIAAGTATNFASGSEVVVLGWDPDDTHTDNFWEQLADVTLSSAGDTIDSGTITSKKYVWIQIFQKATGSTNYNLQFNSDTGSNYSYRASYNGGSDASRTSQSKCLGNEGSAVTTSAFHNIFIVNNSANEKLSISQTVRQETAGAGTSPNRQETVGKWTNTSSQITSVQLTNSDSGSFDTGSIIKVWGSN